MSETTIKEQLYQYAAEFWGHDNVDPENFDPLVDLLFGAFAVELNRSRQLLQSSEGRITERICQLLLPDGLTTPEPAHALLTAYPVEPAYELKKEDQFSCKKELSPAGEPSRTETKNLVFSPTLPLRLVQAKVLYEAKGNKLTHYSSGQDLLIGEGRLPDNEIFLGIETAIPVKDLNQLRFFVDVNQPATQLTPEQLIHLITFEVDGARLPISSGYGREYENLVNDWSPIARTEGRVNAIYENCFITADLTGLRPEKPANLPAIFYGVFQSNQLETLKQNLFWVNITLPAFKAAEWRNNIRFHLNAFPACNRSLTVLRDSRKVEPSMNYIPMVCEDHFLGVHQVTDENGSRYSDPSPQSENAKYAVVKEGVARFDARNAREWLEQVLVTMRDEASAFTAINGLEYGKITRMKELLNQVEENLCRFPDHHREVRYLKVNATSASNIYLSYWQTTGKLGNHIPSGTPFEAATLEIKSGSAYSLTSSRGGENAPDEKKKINHLRGALLSRERLVTRQDFKIASQQELGNEAARVEVKPGVVVNACPTRGMEKCIEVWVYPAEGNNLGEQDWSLKAVDLQKLLARHSALFLPVRVKIKHQAGTK